MSARCRVLNYTRCILNTRHATLGRQPSGKTGPRFSLHNRRNKMAFRRELVGPPSAYSENKREKLHDFKDEPYRSSLGKSCYRAV